MRECWIRHQSEQMQFSYALKLPKLGQCFCSHVVLDFVNATIMNSILVCLCIPAKHRIKNQIEYCSISNNFQNGGNPRNALKKRISGFVFILMKASIFLAEGLVFKTKGDPLAMFPKASPLPHLHHI